MAMQTADINQEDLILNNVLNKGQITHLEALDLYSCFRLGARIYDLRQQDYIIGTRLVSDGKKKYAEYFYIDRIFKEVKGQYLFI